MGDIATRISLAYTNWECKFPTVHGIVQNVYVRAYYTAMASFPGFDCLHVRTYNSLRRGLGTRLIMSWTSVHPSLSTRCLAALEDLGFSDMTPVQVNRLGEVNQ